MPTPEDRSVVTVPPFLALKGQLDGLSPEGRLYRIHELNPQERSLSLCCAESYEIVHRNLIGLKSLPSLLYTGQLVTLDEENKAISNAVFQCDRKAVRTINDAELPILFSPKPPHSLSSAAGNRERVLEDLLSQGSVLPGAWMAGVYSVHPADLASYALKPTDLWIVTPEPNNLPSSPTAVSTAPMSATPTWSQGHYLWLSVPNLSCIDIGAGGPLFRNNVVIS
ncbi:hypothetical protein GNI_028440 [Gregarina niphandrodes]|uniref:Uncharacterized protein n=1 Tax=Gregarina niphandrodes TaxID=110365 RepID=A0A023BB60_GRENI|nr:hypothetical protein GNI_028440 [Gregarina niphandrodes]EZG79198.1 hypothetical protein GNI_028440 [Gregarina niphandrodes]|eukprot:XP_011129113.1 hypothetical protein GNI_028440 [Gregarina niphandrodes]